MTTGDIDDLNSLYKVDVDPGQSNYTLFDGRGVYIKKVEFKLSDSDNRVETLQRILNRALGPQPITGISPPVCIYYVKNAESLDDAGKMMDAYSKNNTDYKEKKTALQVRRYINLLNHSNLKTNSGGRRHRRRSRRGKGKGNGRGKKSRSSKTLRRGRR
jgi:hypothetical protein